jgi:hypothetical protein
VRRGLLLLLLFAGADAQAQRVQPVLTGNAWGLELDALDYPSTLPRELQSGLTNRLFLRVSVLDGTAVLQQRTAEIAIRYDLWEQTFIVTLTLDRTPPESQKLATLADVTAYLAALRISRLFARTSLPHRALVLRAELLLNPIGREKLRMIRKWVADNSTPEVGADRGPSSGNALFNRIFEQYADGSDMAAVWRVDLRSRPFNPDDSVDEAH